MPISQPDVKWLRANHLPSNLLIRLKAFSSETWRIHNCYQFFKTIYDYFNFSLEKQAGFTNFLLLTPKKAVANDIVDKKALTNQRAPTYDEEGQTVLTSLQSTEDFSVNLSERNSLKREIVFSRQQPVRLAAFYALSAATAIFFLMQKNGQNPQRWTVIPLYLRGHCLV